MPQALVFFIFKITLAIWDFCGSLYILELLVPILWDMTEVFL